MQTGSNDNSITTSGRAINILPPVFTMVKQFGAKPVLHRGLNCFCRWKKGYQHNAGCYALNK
jgi:hypothetical protein